MTPISLRMSNNIDISDSNLDLDETDLFLDTQYINSNYNLNNHDSILPSLNRDSSMCSSLTSVRTYSLSIVSLPTPKTGIDISTSYNNNHTFFPESFNSNIAHSFASTVNIDEDNIATSDDPTEIFGTSCNDNFDDFQITERMKLRRNAIVGISSSVQNRLLDFI